MYRRKTTVVVEISLILSYVRLSASTMTSNLICLAMITIRNRVLPDTLLPGKVDILQCNLNL